MEISERIVALRKARKLSRYKLGQLSGVSKTHLDNIEHGKNSPSVEILSQLLDVLDCSLSEFFNEDGNDTYLSSKELEHLCAYRSLTTAQQDAVNLVIDTFIVTNTDKK